MSKKRKNRPPYKVLVMRLSRMNKMNHVERQAHRQVKAVLAAVEIALTREDDRLREIIITINPQEN